MNRSFRTVPLAVFALAIPAFANSENDFINKWTGYGFFTAASSIAETRAGLKGGGAGLEAYVWKRLAAGAALWTVRDNYYHPSYTVGCFGTYVAWHFARREKARGADPFLSFGAGTFFSRESGLVYHGGPGVVWWFRTHVGARFEFLIQQRQYGDNVYGMMRLGVALR